MGGSGEESNEPWALRVIARLRCERPAEFGLVNAVVAAGDGEVRADERSLNCRCIVRCVGCLDGVPAGDRTELVGERGKDGPSGK